MTPGINDGGLGIVERLRQPTLAPSVNTLRNEAADTIETLYAALERVAQEASLDDPAMWEQVETALAKARGEGGAS